LAGEESSLDTVAQADATPEKRARRWLLEIKLAKKREKDWRQKAIEIIYLYRGYKRKKNSFNILWSNTEVLRPALYNSSPKPDVRRRFRQQDVLGKAVSELMERSLAYCADAYSLDDCIKADVLNGLLPGRGVSRVRYVPKFKTSAAPQKAVSASAASGGGSTLSTPTPLTPARAAEPDEADAFNGEQEEVDYEQALCETVQWDDLLHGPGKTWDEVQWVAFRHRLRRDDLREQFGVQIGDAIQLNDVADDDVTDKKNVQELADVFKRAEVWEVWDKESRQVFFVNESYKKGVIYALAEEGEEAVEGEPPLKLRDFFPIPRPLQLVEDTATLVPNPLYELYREQAEELNETSRRINRIVKMVKVRGVYDSTLGELAELMKSPDGDLLAAERAAAYMNNGGLEKAIWFMPIEQIAACLKYLYEAREAAKQVIYEITGIADVIRGASDPQETLGAQKIKSNNFRVQRMQREVQRYTRDLVRLLAEVIGQHFSEETLASMTGLQFPTQAQKAEIGLQMQVMQQRAQPQPGQPPAPPPPQLQAMQNAMQMPAWEDIMACLRDDICRQYRIDIETDSTVAEQLQTDMAGMKEILTGVVELFNGLGPAVSSGALTIEAAKSLVMSLVRRARMGLEVEDALEQGMQAPKPQANPEAAKAQVALQTAQAKAQADAQELQARIAEEKAEGQRQVAIEVAKHQREMAEQQAQAQAKANELAQKHASDMQEIAQKHAEAMQQAGVDRYKVDQDNAAKIEVAEIAAGAVLDKAQADAAQGEFAAGAAEGEARPARKPRVMPMDKLAAMHKEAMDAHGQVLAHVAHLAHIAGAPRENEVVQRDASGRVQKTRSRILNGSGAVQ